MEPCTNDLPQKPFSSGEKPRPVFLTVLDKKNAKSRPKEITSRYKLGITSQPPSPTSKPIPASQKTFVRQRAMSADRKRPSTPPSPSSPKSSLSSSPCSTPSTPSSPPSNRSTTPTRDSLVDRLTTTRRSLVGRVQDGLWPSIRNISTSFQSEPSPNISSKSERKRTPLRGRNTNDQSENSNARTIEQHRWPSMMGGKVSSNANKSRGVSPIKRVPVSEDSSVSPLPSENDTLSARQSRNPSPIPQLIRPSSPTKASPIISIRTRQLGPLSSKGLHSPPGTRSSTTSPPTSNATSRVGIASSAISFIADVQKGKNASHMEDVHQLRMLYNRDLQWRFINARADFTFSTQKQTAEDMLYNVWNTTSQLRDNVVMKRIDVQNLKRDMRLDTVLEEQMAHLEDWSNMEEQHSDYLSEAIEALKSCTLRLPVTGKTSADVRAVRNAISSAVDIMQLMGSSICSLLSRLESTSCLVYELSEVVVKERAMLAEYRELLASTTAMQVQECSLRANLMQLTQQDLLFESEYFLNNT